MPPIFLTFKDFVMSYGDISAQAVYDWEAEVVEPHAVEMLDKDGCRAILREVCRLARLEPPRLIFTPLRVPCYYEPRDRKIRIAEWGRTRVTVLHEIAHYVDHAMNGLGAAPHGPNFVRIAMALYARYVGVPLDDMEKGAAVRRVPFADRSAFSLSGSSSSDFFDEDF